MSSQNQTIEMSEFYSTVYQMIESYGSSVETALTETKKILADKTAKDLKSTSPVGRGRKSGTYGKNWTWTAKSHGEFIVYNKKTYRLTHLLEYGHATRLGTGKGRYTYGSKARTKAQPHIGEAERKMKDEIGKVLEEQLGLQYRRTN